MAPEVLSTGKTSLASDVYAFAMLVHEVCRWAYTARCKLLMLVNL